MEVKEMSEYSYEDFFQTLPEDGSKKVVKEKICLIDKIGHIFAILENCVVSRKNGYIFVER